MIQGIIFDMDGVLVDSERHEVNVAVPILREYGAAIEVGHMKNYMGMNMRDFVTAVAEEYAVEIPVEECCEKIGEERNKYYAEVFPLVPGVKEVLEKLSVKYLIGLSTSTDKRNAETVLAKYQVLEFFQARTYGDQVSRGKPDPEIYLKSCEGLGLEPEECVVVEDSRTGFAGVMTAGMKLVGRRAGHNQNNDFSVCDAVLDDMSELPQVIKNLNQKL